MIKRIKQEDIKLDRVFIKIEPNDIPPVMEAFFRIKTIKECIQDMIIAGRDSKFIEEWNNKLINAHITYVAQLDMLWKKYSSNIPSELVQGEININFIANVVNADIVRDANIETVH